MDQRENKIREIAYDLYIKYKQKGFEDNQARDWTEAENIYGNRFKYILWQLGRYSKKLPISSLFSSVVSSFLNKGNISKMVSGPLSWINKYHYEIVAIMAILAVLVNMAMMRWSIVVN